MPQYKLAICYDHPVRTERAADAVDSRSFPLEQRIRNRTGKLRNSSRAECGAKCGAT